METKLFGKSVDLKSNSCSLNGNERHPIKEPYVNLYIQLKGCNAKCIFCEFRDCANQFSFERFKLVLSELQKSIPVNKVSITGGEPTFDLKKLYKIADLVKNFLPDAYFVVNSNGYQLLDVYKDGKSRMFDSISLSRHHYKDEINNKILGFKSLSANYLESIQHSWWQQKEKLHLSCNLIKGHIDSPAKIYKYLEFANQVKIHDVGFVSLMKINYFCKNNFINFSDLDFKNKKMFQVKEWKFLDACKCNNYLYIPKKMDKEVVKVYARCTLKHNHSSNIVVFDGENLKFGFNGLTLI